MTCRRCGCFVSRVLETRARQGVIRRRRQCNRCGHVYWTMEVDEWRAQVSRRISAGVRAAQRKDETYSRDMQIVAEVRAGSPKADVAARFNVATSTVSYILGKYAPELKARRKPRRIASVFDLGGI